MIRPLVSELQNVFAQVGLYRLQAMMLQPLVEVDLLGGHRLRFHDQPRLAVLGQGEHEVGDLVAVLAIHNLAAMRGHLALELLEVVIQVLDRVLLDGAGLRAQVLVFGKFLARDRVLALVDQPACGRVDRELQLRIRNGLVDLPIESSGHA